MNRWRACVLAGLGIAGRSAVADDVWRPATAPPPSAVTPAGLATPPRLIPIPADPVPPPTGGEWQPARTPPADLAPAAPVVVPLPPAVTVDVPPAFPVPVIPSVLPVTASGELPAPKRVGSAEPAPSPRPTTIPPADTPLPGEALPSPRPLTPPPPGPLAPNLTAPAAAPDPLARRVWGVGGLQDKEVPANPFGMVVPAGGPVPPVRHGAYGSKDLSISRDYHFLDAFGRSPLAGENGAVLGAAAGPAPGEERFYVLTEYLLWWVRPMQIPVLATTGPTPANLSTISGVLGQPGTVALLGGGGFGPGFRDGFRLRAGGWLDGPRGLGVDGSYFTLGSASQTARLTSDQYAVITRPFFAPNRVAGTTPPLPGQFGERVAAPGNTTGAFDVVADSYLWGADVNVRCCICTTCDYRAEWFAGFRNVNLVESLQMTEYIFKGGNPPPPLGTVAVVQDRFAARNNFYGGQVGYATGRSWGRMTLDARASVALGTTHQTVDVTGYQYVGRPGEPVRTFTGGLLAAGPNLGTFERNVFSVVPEVTVTAGYLVTPRLSATFGYNFLSWSGVARPGDQIDPVVDLAFVPNVGQVNGQPIPASGLNRPAVPFKDSTLWVQGVQFGVQYRW